MRTVLVGRSEVNLLFTVGQYNAQQQPERLFDETVADECTQPLWTAPVRASRILA